MILFVMGVSGSGKSTIGKLLAERLGISFYDGDDFHSAANKAKMAGGHPLTDADREPWLAALNELARSLQERGEGSVIVCSALKQQYRDQLSDGLPPDRVQFILLEGSRELIAGRLASRAHEFMNPNLLGTQFKTLEPPAHALRVVNDHAPQEVVDEIVAKLSAISAQSSVGSTATG